MRYRGFLSDFDGTVHHSEHMVSEGVIDALRLLQARGIKFGFSTGRQFDFIRSYASRFGEVHVVCGGACLITSKGQVLRQQTIPEEVIRDVVHLIDEVGGAIAIKTPVYGYGNPLALELARNKPGLVLYPISELESWNIVSFYCTDIYDEAWDRLAARTDIHLIKQHFRSGVPGFFADGTAPGVSKTTGSLWWCEYHNLDPQEVIAIGDGENDHALFEAVGLGLAMGNAVPELKARADAVVPGIQEDGVAWAIQHYFDVQEEGA